MAWCYNVGGAPRMEINPRKLLPSTAARRPPQGPGGREIVPVRGGASGAPVTFGGAGFEVGLFCAAPTILEAINAILHQRGMATLWVQPDGTIGPTDPLLARVEYVPTPFYVC
jgi:hypothetical protein